MWRRHNGLCLELESSFLVVARSLSWLALRILGFASIGPDSRHLLFCDTVEPFVDFDETEYCVDGNILQLPIETVATPKIIFSLIGRV